MTTASETLTVALAHHRAGRTAAAESAYRQLLIQDPEHIDALNLLGALVYQQHRFEEAIACFTQVLALQPDNPDAYNSMGIALKGQGHFKAAVNYYQQALERQPTHVEALNNLGNALKELGELEAAIAAYQKALSLRPHYAEAHNNLGIALKEQGQWETAIAHYQQAIALRPNYAEAHQNLAATLQRQGNLDEAMLAYRQAIACRSDYPEAHHGLANVLQQQGQWEAAIVQYEQAIALKPNYPEAYHGLANALQQQGQLEAAIVQYHEALRWRPHYPEACNNLGNALQDQGLYDAAIAQYQQALALRPNFAEAHSNLGAALKDQKRLDEAIAHFQQALVLRPDYAEVHNNLGNAYQDQGNLDAAIACYRKALALNPSFAEIHSNLGNLLQQQGQFAEAFAQFEAAIAAQPDYAGAYNNLGIARRNHGEIEAAFAAYDRALALQPDFVEAHWNRALTQLFVGDLKQGFAGYEWRFQWDRFKEQNPPRNFTQPRWDGSDLHGKTILLHTEQGLGDTIQFVRYAALVAARGGQVILECQPALVSLLQHAPGIQQVIPAGSPLPSFEVQAPLMSLPHILGTTLETVPATIPYLQGLSADAPGHIDKSGNRFNVGIVWEGNPQNPYNQTRACPLTQLLPLSEIPGVTLYSLQKEPSPADQQILEATPTIRDLRHELHDFVATAIAIDQLDLVIAVDTAVAHLAGALGKPVWLLLPFAPDWRWLHAREQSPWYPTMRLFRQPSFGDWDSVLIQVEMALRDRVRPNQQTTITATGSAGGEQQQPLQQSPPRSTATTALLQRAFRLYQTGQPSEAEALCQQVLRQRDKDADALHLLGMLAHQQRNYAAAIAHYQQALVSNPKNHDTYNNLAVAYQEQNQLDTAIAHYEKAIALKPDYADAHNNYANALRQQGQIAAAIQHYQHAIALRPNYADAHNNLGLVYFTQGDFAQAAACYQQAIACKADYPQAHNHLGNALKELGEFDQAVTHYATAIALKPDYAKAYNNWGNVFRDQGDLPTAVEYYNQATAIEPDFAEAHWNKALTLLLQGDLQAGFTEYEWRWQVNLPTFQPMRPFPQPLWDGSSFAGKTLFLHAEQGMGDMIQFVRYVPLIAQQGGHMIVECHKPLMRLFERLPHVQQVVPYGNTPPAFDVHAPLMSLPHLLGISLDAVPAAVPYLTGWETPTVRLDDAVTIAPLLKVGLVWTGNPQNPYNRTRACPLAQLLSLADLPGIRLYSLQKELTPEDAALLQAHPQVQDLRDHLQDFGDTASIIHQLDLVIAVDTAVAHLAGALGKPVWLLLPFAPDWRWMLDREDSPWYPTMRLFRQPSFGDWDSPIAQLRQALTAQLPPTPLPSTAQSFAQQLNAALQHSQNDNLDAAEQICREILRQEPDQVDALHILGVILCRSGRTAAALPYLQRVVQLRPYAADAWGNLGNALQDQGQFAAAMSHYEQAIALQPNYADAHYNLALLLQDQDHLEDALAHTRRVIALKPDFADAYYNQGFILRRLNQLDAAIASYQHAIQLQPDSAGAHKNLGHALLLQGELRRGFQEYEWRWRQAGWTTRPFAQPLWDGSPLKGKTILLHAEQGLGDTLQFIRYAALVRDRGGRVVVECQAPLVTLLQSVAAIDQLVVQDAPLPDFDVHAPLLSLPRILGTTLDSIPASIPYLTAPAHYPLQLPVPAGTQLKVGIVWTGNPNHKNNRYRSCPIVHFQALSQLPGVTLYSLQKGAVADLHALSDAAIYDLSTYLDDFAATAAAIAQLDLVVTIDTSVAHLAGALGKPVWLLLSFAPDWRWLLTREDSPWYPTMRLFRQQQRGDWDGVFERVTAALREWLETRPVAVTSQDWDDRTTASSKLAAPLETVDEPRSISLRCPIDACTDWGIYGMNLALHLRQQPSFRLEALPTDTIAALPPLYQTLLRSQSDQITPATPPTKAGIALCAIADRGFLQLRRASLPPADCSIGLVRLTNTLIAPATLAAMQNCDRLVVQSAWNQTLLQQHGLTALRVPQGVDLSLFHPAPNANLFGDRFVIFAGGEQSYRNGQDLVIAAFQSFYERHPDALLLTAWQPSVDLSECDRDVTEAKLMAHSLPGQAMVSIDSVPYPQLAQLLREADAALFPNRCVAEPNSLAMATLACGVPTVLAANTGHLDLINQNLGYPLRVQTPVPATPTLGTDGWGESLVEEMVETLERIYTNRQEAHHRAMAAADFMQTWAWEKQMPHLYRAIAR